MNAPHNTRPVPAGWQELQDNLEPFVTEGKPGVAQVRGALRVVNEFDNDTLNANRYYSITEVLCQAAQQLNVPAVKAEVIDTSAEQLAERFMDTRNYSPYATDSVKEAYPKDHFTLADIDPGFMNDGFAKVMQEAADGLDPVKHFAADALSAVAGHRQRTRFTANNNMRKIDVTQIVDGTKTARSLTGDSLVGTTTGLKLAYNTSRGLPVHSSTPVTPDELRMLGTSPVLPQLASLRLDTFAHIVNGTDTEAVVRTDDGDVRVARELVKSSPAPDKEDLIVSQLMLHTKRLRCPALHVQGLIPIVAGYVPDILEAAQGKAFDSRDNIDFKH